MSIRRRKKTKAFTQINNAALRNVSLTLKAKGLLAIMMSCPEDWKFYMDWLQQQSADGREAHQSAMKELERHGYVVREKTKGKGGKFSGWDYVVDDEPMTEVTVTGSPTNGKAVSRSITDERENRQSGKPSDGKPATTNMELTKNEFNKEGGVLDVEGDARATTVASPLTPVADLGQPELTTTGDAALQKDVKAVREPTLEVAVLAAPETSDSGDSISDAELEQLFGSGDQANENLEQVTEVQKVAAAGAVPSVAAPAAPLKAPPAPEATREALARALGGAKRLADLLEEIPPGLRQGSRHRWVSEILPERVQELARQGREQETMHPWTAITQLLDREIGATIKRGNGKGTVTAVMPGAYMTAEERDAKSSGLPAVELGETWYSRKSGKAYLVREVTSQSIFVEGVGEYTLVKFHSLFRQEESGSEA